MYSAGMSSPVDDVVEPLLFDGVVAAFGVAEPDVVVAVCWFGHPAMRAAARRATREARLIVGLRSARVGTRRVPHRVLRQHGRTGGLAPVEGE